MQWPEVLDWLADGALTLASIPILAPHLTADNHASLLDSARHKSKRDVEHLVAVLHPQPDVPASIRRCPGTEQPADVLAAIAPPSPSPTRPVVAPLAQERYKVQFTVSRQTHDKLRRAQDLLRHTVPNGDPAEIFDRALTLLVTHLERTKLASVQRLRAPRPAVAVSRHIPASVRRAVWTGMAPGARSWGIRDGVPSADSWNSTTSCRLRTAAPRRLTISSSVAGPTTSSRPRTYLGYGRHGRANNSEEARTSSGEEPVSRPSQAIP